MIRRLPTASFLLVCLVALALCPRAQAEPLGADAMWAWHWEAPEALAALAADAGLSRVHLYAQGGFDPKVRAAITALSERGIAVEALGGEERWATTQRRDMLRFVRSAVRYQRRAPDGSRLAGVHVDVEPHGLRSWDRDQAAVAASLVRALGEARRAAGPLPLSADIPSWFDKIATDDEGSLARAVIRRTDATTIMAYRDSGPEVIEQARREVRIASALGRQVTVGVETAAVRPRLVTFFEEGRLALVRALAQVDSEFGRRSGFAGTAVHHYGSLQTLPNG